MEIYPSYFSLYLASLETPQVPKRTKKKEKVDENSECYPNESGILKKIPVHTTEDEKPSKKKPLLARALHKTIKRVKANEFKKKSANPKLDHQIGNSSFFRNPEIDEEADEIESNEIEIEYLQYAL